MGCKEKPLKTKRWLSIIILSGLTIRLFLASQESFNFDMSSFIKDVQIARLGKNIYLEQPHYNYSPAFLYVLAALGSLQSVLAALPFPVIERAFISSVDLATLVVLIEIAKVKKLPIPKTAALFFLNPIAIYISGYHGQFDNLAIFFLLLGILLYKKKKDRSGKIKTALLWIMATTGLIIKHTIAFAVGALFAAAAKNKKTAILFLASSAVFFLITLLPFAHEASSQIINQVFSYRGETGIWGFSFILNRVCGNCTLPPINILGAHLNLNLWNLYFSAFIVAFFLLISSLKKTDLARICLFGFLYFLTFTVGIAPQYLVLPIALGALFPTIWFYLFSLATSLLLFTNSTNFQLQNISILHWNLVWAVTFLWFSSELKRIKNQQMLNIECRSM